MNTLFVRGRSYQFEEFLMTWGEKLRAGSKMTTVTAGLQRDVDKYQVPNHWTITSCFP